MCMLEKMSWKVSIELKKYVYAGGAFTLRINHFLSFTLGY